MTAISSIVKPISQIQLAPGSVATIKNISWEEFETILQELGEKRISRVAYSNGSLEIILSGGKTHPVPKGGDGMKARSGDGARCP